VVEVRFHPRPTPTPPPPPPPPGWVFKDHNGDDGSGNPFNNGGWMPDFDQNQNFSNGADPFFDSWNNKDRYYCGPTAMANSLWWFDRKFGVGSIIPSGSTPVQLINDLGARMHTNNRLWQGFPSSYGGGFVRGTYADDMQGHPNPPMDPANHGVLSWLEDYDTLNLLYEHTVYDATFPFVEYEIERCQDVVLLLGFWHIAEVTPVGPQLWDIRWERIGGHFVTCAGVNSASHMIAISDPDRDQAAGGGAGLKMGVAHANPSDHNNPNNASLDIYRVDDYELRPEGTLPPKSPGGLWAIMSYTNTSAAYERYAEWNEGEYWVIQPGVHVSGDLTSWVCTTFTEVEAAVIVSPTDTDTSTVPPGASTQVFPTAGVQADFSANDASGFMTVILINAPPPNLADALPKYWAITGLPGHTYSTTLTFDYTEGEVSGAELNEGNLAIYRSMDGGGSWTELGSLTDTVLNEISTASPQSAFSLWAIAQETTPVQEWKRY
jgi:hypothetical protein